MDSQKLRQIFSHKADSEWLEVLIHAINQSQIDGVELPGFPEEQFQRASIGSSGGTALREVFPFYCKIKSYAAKGGIKIKQESCILDFGCGWGRIIRFFLKDVSADNLYGIDVLPEMIDLCKKLVRYGNYRVCNPLPPTEFADESIDVVYAYSVFSHLAEPVHIKWIQEFSRILKPGGILVVTTQPRHFIEFCQSLRGIKHDLEWYNILANAFLDTETALADFDNGKFLYSETGGGPALPSSFYGEAVIPRSYIEREWTKYLEFKDYIDDRSLSSQAIVVMQKPFDNGEMNLEERLRSLEETIRSERDDYIQHIEYVESILNNIYSSRGWKALSAYYMLRDKLFPFNTKRRNLVKLIVQVILKIITATQKVFKKL